jgi:hypothetical protein
MVKKPVLAGFGFFFQVQQPNLEPTTNQTQWFYMDLNPTLQSTQVFMDPNSTGLTSFCL